MKKTKANKADEFRKLADERLKKQSTTAPKLSPEETNSLIHELKVHQIELEMQNDELRKAQLELEKSHAKYSDLYDFAPIGYFTFDKFGAILEANLTGANILGYERSKLIKTRFSDYINKDSQDDFYLHRRKVFKTGDAQNCEIRIKRKDGTHFFVQLESIQVGDNQIRTAMSDISLRKKAEEAQEILNKELARVSRKFKRLSVLDRHTGLYNYRYLRQAIEAEYDRARRHAQDLSVIMIDIDYFKSINDAYGHGFGDKVLKQFGNYLKKEVRKYDIVVRFGGEEFIIISPGTDRKTAIKLARRLSEGINLCNFGEKENTIKLKVSMGISVYPKEVPIKNGMDLVDIADSILHKAKENGGNRVYSSLDLLEEEMKTEIGEEKQDVEDMKSKIRKLTQRSNQSIIETIFAFARTIELKDHYTGEHVAKTVNYAAETAKMLNLPPEEVERVRQASILHDLGKIGISDEILLKKTRLTKKEYAKIKKHSQIAVDILRPIHFLQDVIPLIYYHHEKWDSTGYPSGLKGKQIPIGARIIAIADVYQALTSERPYREAYSKQEAIKTIKEGGGTQFDPDVVDVFLKILRREA